MQEDFVDLHFPLCGLDMSNAFARQPNRPWGNQGRYSRTTPDGVNVRSFEQGSQRARGGSRPGIVKYLPVPVVAGWVLQEMAIITIASASAES